MSRQNDLMTISVDDVVHALRECQRDWKYSGRFEPMLAFASELTGISEDGLLEMMHRVRGIDELLHEASARSKADDITHVVDREIEKLWEELADVPIDENECLDVDWRDWSKGTHREELWHWFDEHHSKGVVWLMYEYEPSNDVEIEKG